MSTKIQLQDAVGSIVGREMGAWAQQGRNMYKRSWFRWIIFASILTFLCRCGSDSDEARTEVGWIVGLPVGDGYGVILHTKDGGNTWVRQGAPGTIPDVSFGIRALDDQDAWLVGEMDGGYGVILRTLDGGNTWVEQKSPVNSRLRRVSFVGAPK